MERMIATARPAAALCLLLTAAFVHAGPDELVLGKAQGYPYPSSKGAWRDMEELWKIGEFSHVEQIMDTQKVAHGSAAAPLPVLENPPALRYRFNGASYSVDDYLAHQRVTGLLILKDGRIVAERYQYERQAGTHFMSFSMAKSITATLVGIALRDGKIKSLDDTVEHYVPQLKGNPYQHVTIRNLLRMSSGVKFNYTHGTGSGEDSDTLNRNTLMQQGRGGVDALAFVRETAAAQGSTFHYSNGDTFVLGLVLQGALGKQSIAEYTAEKLWRPLGAEDNAAWVVDWSGATAAHVGFSARLRDYGRIGLLWANGGMAQGQQIVDRDYLLDATDMARQPPQLQPNGAVDYAMGYGYQFWLTNFSRRTFSALGAYGQQILVQPDTGIVIVMTAASRMVDENIPERRAFLVGMINSLGGVTARPIKEQP